MIRSKQSGESTGSVAPLVALGMVTLTGMAALAVDVGRIAVAKVECQSAADVAAMAGGAVASTGSCRKTSTRPRTTPRRPPAVQGHGRSRSTRPR